MNFQKIHNALTYFTAIVWFANGLLCKILNLVPRHQLIVASILGDEYASVFTIIIGFSEVFMAVWILSKLWTRINAITQMMVVAVMNIIEYSLVPELLLWGKLNIAFAVGFIGLVWYNEFVLNRK